MIKSWPASDVPSGGRAAPENHEQALGQSVALNDQVRLRRAVEQHFGFVGRLLRHSGVFEDLDDALQQVFITLMAKLQHVQPGKERAFLAGCAVHIAARSRRARGVRSQRFESEFPELPQKGPDPEERMQSREELSQLDLVLLSMDESLRTVFLLFEVEEFTMAEIAESLAIAPGTVASRIRRAREIIQESLAHGR